MDNGLVICGTDLAETRLAWIIARLYDACHYIIFEFGNWVLWVVLLVLSFVFLYFRERWFYQVYCNNSGCWSDGYEYAGWGGCIFVVFAFPTWLLFSVHSLSMSVRLVCWFLGPAN